MLADLEYRPISDSQDWQQLGEITSQCFGTSLAESQRFLNRNGKENLRLICHSGKVIGGLSIHFMGQWYGGQSVPMAGVAGVGIAPEYRGTGAAYELMSQTLQELHQREIPVSVLYAAAQRLYRKVGYEQAGARCSWELPTATIQLQERDLPMSSVDPSSTYPVFQTLYSQQAKGNNGNLVRNQAIWENVADVPEGQLYSYLIGSRDRPQGYLLFTQRQADSLLYIQDWATLTADAARRLWTFLGDHRSQIERVRWFGAPLDPFLMLLPEQTAKIGQKEYWMLRIVNVPLALSKRGYPLGVQAELHLEVRDDLIGANDGKFCLSVAGGSGEVSPGGKGELKLDIRSLASLYTGLLTPTQLHRLGWLEATPEALSAATLLFAGSEPWMPDFF